MKPRPELALVTTFGLGHMRPASGTWGSIPPVVVAGLLVLAGATPAAHPVIYNGVLVAILVVFSGACVVLGDLAEARFNKKDPSEVVADETAGQCIALLLLPHATSSSPWKLVLMLSVAFLAFRFFDITKPPPARGLQSIRGGWGILLDDLIAGCMAFVVVQIVGFLA